MEQVENQEDGAAARLIPADAIDAWIEEIHAELKSGDGMPDLRQLIGRVMYETGLDRDQARQRVKEFFQQRDLSYGPMPAHVSIWLFISLFGIGFLMMLISGTMGIGDWIVPGALLMLGSIIPLLLTMTTRLEAIGPPGQRKSLKWAGMNPIRPDGSRPRRFAGKITLIVGLVVMALLGVPRMLSASDALQLASFRFAAACLIVLNLLALWRIFNLDIDAENNGRPFFRWGYGAGQLLLIGFSVAIMLGYLGQKDVYFLFINAINTTLWMQPRPVSLNWKAGGKAAIHHAIESRDTKRVARLLSLKPDLTIRDAARRTPLALARALGDQAIAEQLLAAGAIG